MSMKRPSPSLHLLVAATSTTSTTSFASSTAMSSRATFRGGRGRGRRSYSDRATSNDDDSSKQVVSGDSHFGQVRDTNRSFRPQNNRGSFKSFPPPPSYDRVPPPPFYNRVEPLQSYNRVPPPPFYNRMQPPHSYNRVLPSHPYNIVSPAPPPSYNFVPPSSAYNFYPSQHKPLDQNQQIYTPPPFDFNQHSRPPWQHQQQIRPRPPKDLEYRNWQYANPGPPPESERFTILSYNILADYLARDHWNQLYFHIPRHFLDWERRKRCILFELGLWSADIMCLQEVDRFQDLKEELELRGYSGIWKMRTGDPVDGCAIFWRNSRFKLSYEESLEFCKLGLRDNIAQICVFESLGQSMNNDTAAATSSAHAKKLVVCNIHVLFNPKRGEIKLGQVRVLLSRAHAVSKLWDDAPLVLCGDFNSTPKSPLYNFIAEQKLDLSELPRDKVSGQASAAIHLPRPSNPRYGSKFTENSSNRTQLNGTDSLDFQKPESPNTIPGNGPSTDSLSQSISTDTSKGNNDKQIEKCDFHGRDGCDHEVESNIRISHGVSEECASSLGEDAASSVSLSQDVINDLTLQESRHRDIDNSETMTGCNNSDFSSGAKSPSNSINTPENKGTSTFCRSTELAFPCESCDFLEVSVESPSHSLSLSAANEKGCISTSCESTTSNFQLEKKMESLSLTEVFEGSKEGEIVGEEDRTFLSELHGGPFPSYSPQFEELEEPIKQSPSSDSQELHSLRGENTDNSPALETSGYDPSAWTPVEIETATGNPVCSVMEHALKLQSVYGEVEDSSGRRDSTGEPAVTSYHRRFMGTVDYIWRSEGVQTARILAPIPKHAMLWTKGFPTKKWGSDHIALVSELAFKEDISSQNVEVH